MKKILVALLLILSTGAYAQKGWVFSGGFNFGANLNLVYGKGQKFPGYKLFAGFIANGVYKNRLIVNYGPSFAIYTKGIGANLNPMVNDIQLDLINSFSFGAGGNDLNYYKYIRTVGNAPYYNVMMKQNWVGLLSTNFILNNHHHNQVNGSVTISSPWATLTYYNDGAPPFTIFPLADNFDRYWTGGICLYVHNKQGYNDMELSFDQFTGYVPLLYEMATKLGINIPNYNVNEDEKVPPDFNTSALNLRIFPMRGFGIDAGILGALKSNNGRSFGLQEIIHTLGNYAMHPNNDVTRYYIGGTYNNMNNVRFK